MQQALQLKKAAEFQKALKIRKTLELFLKKNWKENTPEELVILWNHQHPEYNVGALKILEQMQRLKSKLPEYEQSLIKKSDLQEEFCSSEEFLREQRIKLMCRRFKKKLNLWTGKPLTEVI